MVTVYRNDTWTLLMPKCGKVIPTVIPTDNSRNNMLRCIVSPNYNIFTRIRCVKNEIIIIKDAKEISFYM